MTEESRYGGVISPIAIDACLRATTSVGGRKKGDYVSPVPAIDGEISFVDREHAAFCHQFGHADEAGVSEVHLRPIAAQEALDVFGILFDFNADS